MKTEVKGSKKETANIVSDSFLEYAKDEKMFQDADEDKRLAFTAGFIRGASWMLKKHLEGKDLSKLIKRGIETKVENEPVVKTGTKKRNW